jgi:tetratricopeptide (TPR) repeat protein
MGGLMVGMAALGASGATYFQSGKVPASEENHSNAHEEPQITETALDEPVQDQTDSDPTVEARTAAPENVKDTTVADSDSGSDRNHADEPDPFSESSLGFDSEASSWPGNQVAELPTDSPQARSSNDKAQRSDEMPAVPGPAARTAKANAPGVPSRQEHMTQQAVNLMVLADEELASGNYVQAMQAYQTLRQKSEGGPGPAILFRLALCAEAAGRHAAAIEAYRKISATQNDSAWAGIARYGEARCLSATKKHTGLQTDLLRRAVLDEREFVPTVRGEVLHLIGRDLWREQTTMVTTDLLSDQALIVPEWSADPARLLEELPLLIHETPVKSGPIEFRVLHTDDMTPDDIYVRLNCGMTRVESLLRNLITGCRLKCEITESAIELLQGRTQQVHVSEQSLALLLDGITISSGVAWQVKNGTVSVVHLDEMKADELRMSRLAAAERMLRIAVMDMPTSPQAGHSRMALSTLLFEQQRAADALQFLQVQIESSPRSIVETEAAFNLGKCLMILNQRDESKQAFLRSIDASGGLIDVKIAAYIFHSRMLIEDFQGKMAVQSMMRGLSLSKGSELEPFAALHLASLYLMLSNPQGANAVLMDRREELDEGPGREGAAFLSAFSRFRAAVLADRREREGATVVSALSEFSPAGYCGGHWAVLTAEACDELGLTQESTESYVLALKKLPPSDLRNKTMLRLADRYQAENQLEEAKLVLASLTTTEASQLSLQARLRSAEMALAQNRPDEAIVACRQLIDSTELPELERAALRIMGQAYERQKNHQAAIYCFAGLLPDKNVVNSTAPGTSLPTAAGGQ